MAAACRKLTKTGPFHHDTTPFATIGREKQEPMASMRKPSLHKELQRTIAFRAVSEVNARGGSKKRNELWSSAHELYFGNPNRHDVVMGYAQQLLLGMNEFAHLFQETAPEAAPDVVPRGATQPTSARLLTIKPILHCLEDGKSATCNNPNDKESITMLSLTSTAKNPTEAASALSDNALTPRTIWNLGKAVEANGKKCLALLVGTEYDKGKFPSGCNYDDYLNFVRQLMYTEELKRALAAKKKKEEQKKGATAAGSDVQDGNAGCGDAGHGDEDLIDVDDIDFTVPPYWYFPGFFAFALWGPTLPPGIPRIFDADVLWGTAVSSSCPSSRSTTPIPGATSANTTTISETNSKKRKGSREEARQQLRAEVFSMSSSSKEQDQRALTTNQLIAVTEMHQRQAIESNQKKIQSCNRQTSHLRGKVSSLLLLCSDYTTATTNPFILIVRRCRLLNQSLN